MDTRSAKQWKPTASLGNGCKMQPLASPTPRHRECHNKFALAAASVQGFAPPVGGGLPGPVPMEWVPRMNRWWPMALVTAMANASQTAQVASGPSAMTVESSGAALPETISTTAPGSDHLSPSVGSLQIQDRDDDMSSQPPPYTGEAGDADMTQ